MSSGWRRRSLLWRVLTANVIVLGIAIVVLSLSPATVPGPESVADVLVLAIGLAALSVVNFLLLRRTLGPLRDLTELMHAVDPLDPGTRIPEYGRDSEVIDLTGAFNQMLQRLEDERRQSTRFAVRAQEGERMRISQELHDEVGQSLTAALLQLDNIAKSAPADLRERLAETADTVRASLEDTRRVAARLRPEALDDLGLPSALQALRKRLAGQTGLEIELDLAGDLPDVAPECEIVVYRVTQEALTNVLRHARASKARVTLGRVDSSLRVSVTDDGVGLAGSAAGGGMVGMRERAMLVGGTLELGSPPGGGTEVTLEVPVGDGRP
jgi:two-component system sensor histidine kinase UhpB